MALIKIDDFIFDDDKITSAKRVGDRTLIDFVDKERAILTDRTADLAWAHLVARSEQLTFPSDEDLAIAERVALPAS